MNMKDFFLMMRGRILIDSAISAKIFGNIGLCVCVFANA